MRALLEVTIEEWAENKGIPLRTAQEWAEKRKIPARKGKRKVTYQVERMTETYYVKLDVEPPKMQGKSLAPKKTQL